MSLLPCPHPIFLPLRKQSHLAEPLGFQSQRVSLSRLQGCLPVSCMWVRFHVRTCALMSVSSNNEQESACLVLVQRCTVAVFSSENK